MNRIKISPLAMSETSGSSVKGVLSPRLRKDLDEFNRHRNQVNSVFVPIHYEQNYRYPLVIWLHSDGESSTEIHQVMPKISMRNYIGVAPDGLAAESISPDSLQGPLHKSFPMSWHQDSDSIESAHTSVVNAVEMAMARFAVNPQRVFIGGFGSGGTMAFRVAMERPELFAGVMSLNGPMPESQAPLGCWDQCRNLPVLWAQSRKSETFDQDTLCRQLKLLHVAGFAVTLRQYPIIDVLSEKLLQDVNRWIMEVVKADQPEHQRRAK